MCDQQSLRSACAYAQSDQSLCYSLGYSIIVKLLIEHHLEFLTLKGGCRGSSMSTHVKMPHCWRSHALAHLFLLSCNLDLPFKLMSMVLPLLNSQDISTGHLNIPRRALQSTPQELHIQNYKIDKLIDLMLLS